jgi:hypothetical protein
MSATPPVPPVPPGRVPTLTEVVSWPDAAADAAEPAAADPALPAEPQVAASTHPPSNALAQAQLTERVLADVQRQVDLMLDYRLREVLTPLLSRMADNLVREARAELASTLREAVSLAVAQELSRHRVR